MADRVAITLEKEEVFRMEAIIMGRDRDEALRFLKEVIRAKIARQGTSELNKDKGFGMR